MSNLMDLGAWSYVNPVSIHFGPGSLAQAGRLVAGRPYCLISYDELIFRQIRQRIESLAGLPALVIDNVTPNPDFLTLTESCRQWSAARVHPQVILAVGGGSVMDSAKVLAAADGDFERVRRFLEKGDSQKDLAAVPLICVPTTAGTGSEVTMWAALWDSEKGKKYSLARPRLYPEHAIVDPELMLEMPRSLTISTGLDALSHSLESIWNKNANPVSTHHSVFAAREILEALPQVVARPDDLGLRGRMARAAMFAGLGFSNTKTALAHSISYPITLRHGVPHGLACSFSLPMVMRSVIGVDPECDEALERIFEPDLGAGADRLEQFLVQLGVSPNPKDYGVVDAEWRELIEHALEGERGRNHLAPRERVFEVVEFA